MKKLHAIIRRFPKSKILIVGDLILDEYIWGAVERISPEAPVPVVWANKRTYVPGGAANVAYNIASLGAAATVVGVTGDDATSKILFCELKKRRIITQGICSVPHRHTTIKTRIVAGHQQIVRVDWEHTDPLSDASVRKMENFIEKNIDSFDAVIIEDYGKGVINPRIIGRIIDCAHRHKKIITVDPKEDHFQYYRGVSSITPNKKELENAIRNLRIKDTTNTFKVHNDRLFSDRDLEQSAAEVIRYLKLDSLLVTLGECGMRLFERSGKSTHIPTAAQEVFDVSGAGDTVIASFTLALSCGAAAEEAARIANFAAGIVVSKLGTAVTTRQELMRKVIPHG